MIRSKIANLLIVGFDGTTSFSASNYFKHLITSYELGGVILFKRNIEKLPQLIELMNWILFANSTNNIITSVDQEGGRVARLKGISTDIPPMSFINNTSQAAKVGNILGSELRSLGFNLDFAPVCDVFINPDNQVIGDRSFSHDADIVALMASYVIQGLKENLVASCAKHFPGHGDTAIDSHLDLPLVNTAKEVILSREILPFKKAIQAGVDSIMTAHLVAKNLDDQWPATMSSVILKDILRKELGFKNIIISDDLEMKAVADNYDLELILQKSLEASVNMFIIAQDENLIDKSLDILENFYNKDQKFKSLIDDSIRQVKHLKSHYRFTKNLEIDNALRVIQKNTASF